VLTEFAGFRVNSIPMSGYLSSAPACRTVTATRDEADRAVPRYAASEYLCCGRRQNPQAFRKPDDSDRHEKLSKQFLA
jgi:hypothetical protein